MDLTLLHPKIVHMPIALAVLIPFLSAGVLLAWWRSWLPRRTWLVALSLQGVLVASSFAALQTGEADEEAVEAVVPERFIEAHEEAAEVFMWAAAAALLLFLGASAVRDERLAGGLATASVVAAFVVLGLGYRVGEAGGALVYEHGAASAFAGSSAARSAPHAPPGGASPAPLEAHEDDDDD
jgi:uncharacterized membrane protein